VTPKAPFELTVTPDEARGRLRDRIVKGIELKKRDLVSQQALEAANKDYQKWDAFNAELLKKLFTSDEIAEGYMDAREVRADLRRPHALLGEKITALYKGIDDCVDRIEAIVERLELIPFGERPPAAAATRETAAPVRSKRVFVVHGRDELAKANLEIFLRELGLDPVVLHRQADEGLTVIEKFEKHSDVGYAFILLTPDEIAYLAAEHARPDGERRKEFRARANVIFEFGYFVGKLGRSRVCCLHTGEVALPSDVHGMIYKKFNASLDEVAYSIIKDLKAAGYAIA
jgi:predicted nucleotide-binding protein